MSWPWSLAARSPVAAAQAHWLDTSSSLFKLPRERALELIEKLGHRRFLFGTDFPMWDHREELERFLSLGLPEEVRDDILHRNFCRLFGVEL